MHRRWLSDDVRRALALLALTACADQGEPAPTCAGWGDVRTVDETVARVKALPEPSIACFIESLDRPLNVMAVASLFSAQPGSSRSPRFFVFTEGLVLSVAADGDGANLLELGELREGGRRSVKAEIVYPLDGPVDPYGHLAYGDGTLCGVCHTIETATDTPLAFVSDVIVPTIGSRVRLSEVWRETQQCDDSTEPDRCAILRAVMGSNDVVETPFPMP